jgi:hypothetical protein
LERAAFSNAINKASAKCGCHLRDDYTLRSRVATRQRRTAQALEQRVAEQTAQLMRANEGLAVGSGSYARSPGAVKPPNTSSANARRMPGRMTHHHRR